MTLILFAKIIGGGVATVSLAGTGVGIGIVFGALVLGTALNPNYVNQMFSYAILGFALTESIALFGLMMAFLLLYGEFCVHLLGRILSAGWLHKAPVFFRI